jgi:hypothetical protein
VSLIAVDHISTSGGQEKQARHLWQVGRSFAATTQVSVGASSAAWLDSGRVLVQATGHHFSACNLLSTREIASDNRGSSQGMGEDDD